MKIEEYWYGFIVVNEYGIAISKRYDTILQAKRFIDKINSLKKRGLLW